MLSYHADADINTNPFELGLDRLVNLDMEADFIGKAALRRIKAQGVTRKQVGLIIEGEPLNGPNTSYWPIRKNGQTIGKVTSASTRRACNRTSRWPWSRTGLVNEAGTERALVVERPFYDPQKRIAAA
jgi:glycine cleavage system aminomethyltransferase T